MPGADTEILKGGGQRGAGQQGVGVGLGFPPFHVACMEAEVYIRLANIKNDHFSAQYTTRKIESKKYIIKLIFRFL